MLLGYLKVDRLPEVPIRAVNMNFCRTEPYWFAPELERVAFLKRLSDPVVERGG
jgi:hypothetical protein